MWSLSSSEQQRLTLEQLQQHSELQYLQELQILQQYQQQQQQQQQQLDHSKDLIQQQLQQQLDQSKDLLQQQLQHTLLYGDQLQLYAGQYGASNSSSSSSSSGLQSAAAAAAAAATRSQHLALKDHNQLLSQYNNYLTNPLLQWQASQDAAVAAAAATHDQTSELTHSIPHVQSHNLYDIPGAASHASSSRKSYDVSSAKETLKKHIPVAFENILQDDQDGLSVSSSRSTPLSPLLPPLPSPVLLPPVSSLLPSPLFSPQLLLHPPQPLLASTQQPERPNSKPPPLVSSKSDTLSEFRLWNSYLSSSDVKTTKETIKSKVDYKEKNVQNENVSSKTSSYTVPERKDSAVHKVSAESSPSTSSKCNSTTESVNMKSSIPSKKVEQLSPEKKSVDNPKKEDSTKPPPQPSRLKVRSLGSLLAVEVKKEKNETKNGSIYSFESSKNNDSCTISKINMGSFLSIESVDSDDNDTIPQLKIDSVFSLGESHKCETNDKISALERLSELPVQITKIQNVPNNTVKNHQIRSSPTLELSKNNDSVLPDTNEISVSNLNDSRPERDALLHMNGVYHVLQNKSSDKDNSVQLSQDSLSVNAHTELLETNPKESFQMIKVKKEVEEIQESSVPANLSNVIETSSLENLQDKNKVENDASNISQAKIKEEPSDTCTVEDKLDQITEKTELDQNSLKLSSDLSQQNSVGMNKESIGIDTVLNSNNEIALSQEVEQFSDNNSQDTVKKNSKDSILEGESGLLNESGDCLKDSSSNSLQENTQISECSKRDSLLNGFLIHIPKDSNDQANSTKEMVENITNLNSSADVLGIQLNSTENQTIKDLAENCTEQNLLEKDITQNISTNISETQNESSTNIPAQMEIIENYTVQTELIEMQKETTEMNITHQELMEFTTLQKESKEHLAEMESEENILQTELTENIKIQNVSTENIKIQTEQTESIIARNEPIENIDTKTILKNEDCELEKNDDNQIEGIKSIKTKNKSKKKKIKSKHQSLKVNTSLKPPILTGHLDKLSDPSQSLPEVQNNVKTENQTLEFISESFEDKKEIISQSAERVSSVIKKEKKSKSNSLLSKSKKKEKKPLPVKTEIIDEHFELVDPIYDSDAKVPACPKSKKIKNFNKTIKKESKISLSWNGKIKAEIKPDVFEFSEEPDIKSEDVFEFTEENEWIPEIYHKVHDGDTNIKETDLINMEINVCDICGLKLKSLKGLLIHRKRHFRLPAADVSLQHSLPAIELHSSLFPPFFGQKDYRLYHRPKLKDIKKQISIGVCPISTTTKKNKKESNHINTISALSGLNGGQLIMIEYSEEFPSLISQVGMCSRIKNYWQPISEEDKVPIGLPHGEYVPIGPHFSPFLASIRKGQVLQALENNMFRAPIYSHKLVDTDFLVIGNSKGYTIRELDGLYTVGQQSPLYEVPQPSSRPSLAFNKNFLKMFVYRLFKKSGDKRRLEMKDIKAAFPSAAEATLRKVLKPCSKFHRTGPNSNYWVLKPEFVLPSDLEINNLVKPEEYCANYSSSTASYRLQEAGYKTQFFSALENGDEEDCEAMEDEIKAAPWNTTRSYITALKGLPCLELTGNADPTGCGEGFSYVFMSQHRRRSKAKQLQRTLRKMQHGFKKTDFRKLPLKKAIKILRRNGVSKEKIKNCERWGVIAMVKKLYEKYNKADYLKITELYKESYQEECQRIFDLQNNSLSSDMLIATDNESEQEDSEDINVNKKMKLEEVIITKNADTKCDIKPESDIQNNTQKLSANTECDKTVSDSSKECDKTVSDCSKICNMEANDCTKEIFKNVNEMALNNDHLSKEHMDNNTTDHEIEGNEVFEYNGEYLNLKVLRVPVKRLTDSDINYSFCEIYNISHKSSQRLKRQLSYDDLSSKRFASESSLSSFSDVSHEGLQSSSLNDENTQTDTRDDSYLSPFSENSREPIKKDVLHHINKFPLQAEKNNSVTKGSLQKNSNQKLEDELPTVVNREKLALPEEDPYDFDANEEHMSDILPLKVHHTVVKRESDNHLSLMQRRKSDQLSFQEMVENMEENDNMEIKAQNKVIADNSKEIDKFMLEDSPHSEKITNFRGEYVKQESQNKEIEQSFGSNDCDILPITDQKREENIFSKANFIIGPNSKCNSKVNYMQGDILRIVRTFQTPDGRKYLRTEIVRNPDVIKAYVNIRTTKDEEYIKNHISKVDEITKKKLRKERRRIQEQLRRIKRHEDKVRKGVVVTKEKKISKKNIVYSTCGACGQVGHMRTNKNCPLNNCKKEEVDEAEESEETNSSSDEEETLVDLTDESKELVKVEGTKIILSASVVKAAEKYKEHSPVTKHLTKRSNSLKDEQPILLEKEHTTIKEKQTCNKEKGKPISKKVKNKQIPKNDNDKDKKCLRRQKQPKRRMSRDFIQTQERGIKRCRTDPRVTLCTFLDSVFNDARNLPGIEDFLMPVYRRDYPDYYTIIKKPMDLSRIKEKINKTQYDSRKDFLDDISLIVNNSKIYNGNHSILTLAAHGLFVFCKEKLDKAENQMAEVEKDMTPQIVKKKRTYRKSTDKPEPKQDNLSITDAEDGFSEVKNDVCNSLDFHCTEDNQTDSQIHPAEGENETESPQQTVSSFTNSDNPQIYLADKENTIETLQNDASFEVRNNSPNNNANFSESYPNISSETVPPELVADPVNMPSNIPEKVDEMQSSSELRNIEFDDIRDLHDASSDGPSYEDVDYLINNVIETTPNSTDELPEDATQILDLVNEANERGGNHSSSDELNRTGPDYSSMNPCEHRATILSDLISYLPNEPLNSSELMENAPNINANANSFQTNTQFPTNFSSDFILNQTNTLTESTVYSTDYSVSLVHNSLNSPNEPNLCGANFSSSVTGKPKVSTNDLISNPIQGLTEMCDQVVEYTESDQVTNYTENGHDISESGNIVTETQQIYTETNAAFIEDGQAFAQESQGFPLKDSSEVEKDQIYSENEQTFAETSQSFPGVPTFTEIGSEVSTKEAFAETDQVYTDTSQVFQLNQEYLETESAVAETGIVIETSQTYEEPGQSYSEAENESTETVASLSEAVQDYQVNSQAFSESSQDYQVNSQEFPDSVANVSETEPSLVEASQLLVNNQPNLDANTNEFVTETEQPFVSTAQDFKDDQALSEVVNGIEETNQELAGASSTVLDTAQSLTDENNFVEQRDQLCSKTNKEFYEKFYSSENDGSYTDATLKESKYILSNPDSAFSKQCEAFSEETNQTSEESNEKAEFVTEEKDKALIESEKSDAERNDTHKKRNQSFMETKNTVTEMDEMHTESEQMEIKIDNPISNIHACIEADQSELDADHSATENSFVVSASVDVDADAGTDQVFSDIDQEFEIVCPVAIAGGEETNHEMDTDAERGCEFTETDFKESETNVLSVSATHNLSTETGQIVAEDCYTEDEAGHDISEFEDAQTVADIDKVLDTHADINKSNVNSDDEQASSEENHLSTDVENRENEVVPATNGIFAGVEADEELPETNQESVGQAYTDGSSTVAVTEETYLGTDYDLEVRESLSYQANEGVTEVGETSIETSESDAGVDFISDQSAHHLTETDETISDVSRVYDAEYAHLETVSSEIIESSEMNNETSQSISEAYENTNTGISHSKQLGNELDYVVDVRENSIEFGLNSASGINEESDHNIFETGDTELNNGPVTESENCTGENNICLETGDMELNYVPVTGSENCTSENNACLEKDSSFPEMESAILEQSSLCTGEIQPMAESSPTYENLSQSVLETVTEIEELPNTDICNHASVNGNDKAELMHLVTKNEVISESNQSVDGTSQASLESGQKLEESRGVDGVTIDSPKTESGTAPHS